MDANLDIFEHLDYRAYLKLWFEHSKKSMPQMSYRYLARKAGVDPGYLAHIFQGNRHMKDDAIPKFAELIGLNPKETKYFHLLVGYCKSRRAEDVQSLFEKLLTLREPNARVLSNKQYRYWMFWYLPAIRLSLLNFDFKGNYRELAKRIVPPISESQAKEGVALLVEMDLISQNEDGVYEVKDLHISTGDKWTSLAIKEFQIKTLELAVTSLRTQPAELRDISTLTMAIPMDELKTLQEMVQEFRSKIAKWAVSLGKSDAVFQLDLATFPISLSPNANLQKGARP